MKFWFGKFGKYKNWSGIENPRSTLAGSTLYCCCQCWTICKPESEYSDIVVSGMGSADTACTAINNEWFLCMGSNVAEIGNISRVSLLDSSLIELLLVVSGLALTFMLLFQQTERQGISRYPMEI